MARSSISTIALSEQDCDALWAQGKADAAIHQERLLERVSQEL
jgi:hypothetical protein